MIVLMVVLLMYFSLMGSMVLILTRVRSILGNGYEGSVSPRLHLFVSDVYQGNERVA